jgi:hypothetical protein
MKAKNPHICSIPDMDAILRDIESPDETVRASAVRTLCPCRSGWDYFEANLPLIRQLQKDASPLVRASALHLFEDADEMQTEGLPTNPREVHNEMLRTKRASRFARDPDELAQMQQHRNKPHRSQRHAS